MSVEESPVPCRAKITYSREFLSSLKNLKYDPPESVIKFNDVYVLAPKPQAHRPRVDRSLTRGTRSDFARGFVTDEERRDIQRKRREVERQKQVTRKMAWGEKPAGDNPEGSSDLATPPDSSKKNIKPCDADVSSEPTRTLLADAQEQQAALTSQDLDGYTSSANKPAARSKIPRVTKPNSPKVSAKEENERRLHQRQKQIGYGYVTHGYRNYLKIIPKESRKDGDPKTPNIQQQCSKRSWDGQLALWRRLLHKYDIDGLDEKEASEALEEQKKVPASHVTVEEREELARVQNELKKREGKVPVPEIISRPNKATTLSLDGNPSNSAT